MKNINTILISQFPLPFHKIGSWTTLYNNYITSSYNLIDIIICEAPQKNIYQNVDYQFIEKTFRTKLVKRITKQTKYEYLKAFTQVIEPNKKYIIQIIDNFGLASQLIDYLKNKKIKQNFYIQFFYHGHAPFFGNTVEARFFNENIDEYILLTKLSYLEHISYYSSLATRFNILHNGVDTNKFYKLDTIAKSELKRSLGVENKKIFIWCSQDKPKKGLFLILDAWKRFSSNNPDCELWIIGTNKKENTESIKYFGKVHNDDLPKYFQVADVFLFSTLCQEGFGLALIEAKHCGCYCIASALGGVPEVLEFGKYGKLIEMSHLIDSWVTAMQEFIDNPIAFDTLPLDKYSSDTWNKQMANIINQAKINFVE